MAGHQWRIADDALEATQLRAGRGANDETILAVLEEFAADVGTISVSTLRQYRDVAAAWPPARREPTVSWTVHREIRHHEDRFKLVKRAAAEKWTVSTARREAGLKAFANLTPQTAIEKADKINEWLRDEKADVQHIVDKVPEEAAIRMLTNLAKYRPEALAAALHDTEVSTAVTAAYGKVTSQNRDDADDRMIGAGFGNLERAGAYYDTLSDLTHILRRAKNVLDALDGDGLDNLSTAKCNTLLGQARKGEAALKFIVSALEGNDQTMDEELMLLLESD
jgi:hypothetical protein